MPLAKRFSSIILVSLIICASVRASYAGPGIGSNLGLRSQVDAKAQGGAFQVPAELRARVDFWKDIFATYTSNQVVIHYRDFPQVRFGLLDFSNEAKKMNPVVLERYKDRIEKEALTAMREQLTALSKGDEPKTPFQQQVVDLLRDIPGGAIKYKRLIDDDLIRTQSGIRERYAEAIRRAWRYLPVMEQIFVSEYGLPRELTRLPFIESSFDYTAYSSVGAAGIWQFMPRTARAHKMQVGKYVDERRDPIRATRAAAEYLRAAYSSLGTWPLAITSYNHGIGGVRSKVKRAGTNNLAAIIEDPRERYFGFASSNFYPEFLAALEIFQDHQKYFPEIPIEQPLRHVSVPIRSSVSANHVARQTGVPIQALKEANYALLDPIWRGAARIPAGYVLRVPIEYQQHAERVITPENVPVRAASKTKSSGSKLPAPIEPAQADEREQRISKQRYIVQPGDSLFTISKRSGASIKKIKQANRLTSAKIMAGQIIIIP